MFCLLEKNFQGVKNTLKKGHLLFSSVSHWPLTVLRCLCSWFLARLPSDTQERNFWRRAGSQSKEGSQDGETFKKYNCVLRFSCLYSTLLCAGKYSLWQESTTRWSEDFNNQSYKSDSIGDSQIFKLSLIVNQVELTYLPFVGFTSIYMTVLQNVYGKWNKGYMWSWAKCLKTFWIPKIHILRRFIKIRMYFILFPANFLIPSCSRF